VYYITLTEKALLPSEDGLQKTQYHKFPIDIYVIYPFETGKPKQFVIGTKRSNGKLGIIFFEKHKIRFQKYKMTNDPTNLL